MALQRLRNTEFQRLALGAGCLKFFVLLDFARQSARAGAAVRKSALTQARADFFEFLGSQNFGKVEQHGGEIRLPSL